MSFTFEFPYCDPILACAYVCVNGLEPRLKFSLADSQVNLFVYEIQGWETIAYLHHDYLPTLQMTSSVIKVCYVRPCVFF